MIPTRDLTCFRGGYMNDLIAMILRRLIACGAYDDALLDRAETLIGDPGWAAVLMIFSFPPIALQVRPYLDLERRRILVTELGEAAQAWSSGERALIDVALSLFNGRTKVDLMAVMSTLNHEWMDTALYGMLAYRQRSPSQLQSLALTNS